jgi:hypothetical protein
MAEESNPRGTTETVQIDGQTLLLAFEGKDPGATIKEYLPAGENLDSWTQLAAVREFDNIDDPAAYAAATIKQLEKDYPEAPSGLIENPKTGTVVFDFVVWPQDGSFVEFNVFRYEKREGGGLVSQQYALRAYKNDAEKFLAGLRPIRERILEQMATSGLQTGGQSDSESKEAIVP